MSTISDIQIASDIISRYNISITDTDYFNFGVVPRDWVRDDWIFFQSHKSLFYTILAGRDVITYKNQDDDIKLTNYDF